jgi:hypothetical protein
VTRNLLIVVEVLLLVVVYAITKQIVDGDFAAVLVGILGVALGRFTHETLRPQRQVPVGDSVGRWMYSGWESGLIMALFISLGWLTSIVTSSVLINKVQTLSAQGYLEISDAGFQHLRFYFNGFISLTVWLLLLVAGGGYLGPRMIRLRFAPMLMAFILTIGNYVILRFLTVEGAFEQAQLALDRLSDGRSTPLPGSNLAVIVLVLGATVAVSLFATLPPFLAAWTRRYFFYR